MTLVCSLFTARVVQSRLDDADKVVCRAGFRPKVQVGQVSQTLNVSRLLVDYDCGDAKAERSASMCNPSISHVAEPIEILRCSFQRAKRHSGVEMYGNLFVEARYERNDSISEETYGNASRGFTE